MVCLPDSVAHDPKVAALSPDARWLYIRCWCHCSEYMTDGVVTASALRVTMGAKRRHVAELVTAGLAHELQSGSVVIYDYLEHNTTRADAERQRVRARERVQSHRKRQCNALRNALQDPLQNALHEALQQNSAHSLDLSISGSGIPGGSSALISSSETGQVARAGKKSTTKAKRAAWREAQKALVPDEIHVRIATERGVDLQLELAKFRDHDFARPREDAAAAFRNWLRGARPATGGNGKPPGLIDHEARRIELNTQARQRQWLLDEAKAGTFGPKLQALAEGGTLDVAKLEAWHARQQADKTARGSGRSGGPTPVGGLLASVAGRAASGSR